MLNDQDKETKKYLEELVKGTSSLTFRFHDFEDEISNLHENEYNIQLA